jgi:hypothetical protein
MKKNLLFALTIMTTFSFTGYASDPTDKSTEKKPATLTIAPEDNGKKFSIGLSVGTTIPLQNYGNKTTNTDTTHINGAAKTGFHFNVTFGYKFSKYIGAMLMVGGSTNAYSPDVTTTSGGTSFSGGSLTPSGSHYVGQYLIGPYATFPVGKKLSIEVRALAGLVTSSYPALSETASASYGGLSFGGSYTFKIKPGAAFGYSAGVGAKYMLGEHIGLTVNAAYTGSDMVYKSSTTTASTTGLYASTTTTTDNNKRYMSIGMINITAGVVFCF